ncbi:nucleoside diphosphate kinase homolog 5-like [Diaphorina citri]|uniref:Nucleoside diphosphate kinase homolog 5-like n=1 Tax=Diaphorina citri TaxID=121845 RepID=A0A1S4EHP2_DIACI|nr:nucleoside diphosphate kinase homolog 5-like [Diaphorina citri]
MAAKLVLEEETFLEHEYEGEEEERSEAESVKLDGDEVPAPIVQNLHCYEYTLALVKPHAFRHVEDIEQTIQEKGFTIVKKKTFKFTPEQAAEFFITREERDPVKVPRLVCYMVSGPVRVMVLAKQKAIRRWLHLMGPVDPDKAKRIYPLSLRAKYGVNDIMNAIYGSRNEEEAARDIRFFFKDIIIEPSNAMESDISCEPSSNSFLAHKIYLREFVYPTLQKGLAELVRMKPAHSYEWFVNWLLENDPFSPKLKPCELVKIPN